MLYVADVIASGVTAINGSTNKVAIQTITVGTEPASTLFDPFNKLIYVADYESGDVSTINTTTNAVAQAAWLPYTGPQGLALDTLNGDVFVTAVGSNNVTVINGTSNTIKVRGIHVGSQPDGIVFDPANGDLYVANSNGTNLTVIDGSNDTVVGTGIAVGNEPYALALDPVTQDLYIANFGSNNVSVVNALTGSAVVSGIPVGSEPDGVLFDPVNQYVYVANRGSNNLSVIDTRTNTVVGSGIATGGGPRKPTFDPLNGEIYVPDYSGRIDVFGQGYPVKFQEYGLPSNSNWSVSIFGETNSSIDPVLGFELLNATYGCSVRSFPGFDVSYPPNVTVSGFPVAVPVLFTPHPYTVVFTETGLPTGTKWGVNLSGQSATSTNGSLSIGRPNGTYGYAVDDVPGWHLATNYGYSGAVAVNAAGVVVKLEFMQVKYAITFTESGLPLGIEWAVTLGGFQQTLAVNGSSGDLSFSDPNGSVPYWIADVPGWHEFGTAYSGSVALNGSAVLLRLNYRPSLYNVTCEETGLSAGTEWSATFGVDTRSDTAGQDSGSIAFNATANGSYGFSLGSVRGYVPLASPSNITVSSAAVLIHITFEPSPGSIGSNGSPGLPGVLGLPGYLGIGLLTGALVAAGVGLFLVRRSKRRSS
jgi:YVTN family beta-propeller protein